MSNFVDHGENDKYGFCRVVQWDNTNIHIGKPSDTDTRKQRATCSNCAHKKAGVGGVSAII